MNELTYPYNAIWCSEEQKNSWVCFRKKISLSAVPKSCNAKVACDTKYWLYVNGKLAVFEGGLNRESYPGCGYYDVIDISSFLKTGDNLIAVIVWYWGNQGRNNVDSKEPGLLFLLDSLDIVSDGTWKTIKHPAYTHTAPPYPSYLYGGYNIGFDGRKDISWSSFNIDDTHWENAKHKECTSWGKLYERPVPLFKLYPDDSYMTVKRDNDRVICTLPYAMHVSPGMKIRCKEGTVIDIRTDRYVVNGGPGDHHNSYLSQRIEYTSKEGVQKFFCLNWLFGEKIIYIIPSEVEIIDLYYRESSYDTDFSGNFTCDNEKINILFEKCRRTLLVCMRDNFMDCPDRERGQWIGDVSSQVPQVFYCLDPKAHMLVKKAICDFINLRKGNVLVGNVPGVHFSELPSQSLNAISDIGMIMSYYMHSGDESVIHLSYDALRNYLLLWNIEDDGLITSRNGNWYWFDHLDKVDEKILENCWYYLCLTALKKMALITNNTDHTLEYDIRAKSIRENISRYMKDDGYRSADFLDDRANAMMLLSGLCDPKMKDICINVLEKVHNSTPYMEYYVLLAMFEENHPLKAMNRMMNRYLPLIENENTTLWEDFSILGTKNHAWSGGPLTLLFKYAAGIYPLEPGYYKVAINPLFTGLKEVKASVTSVKGNISVDIRYIKDAVTINLVLPESVKALVRVPDNYLNKEYVIITDHDKYENIEEFEVNESCKIEISVKAF